MTHPSTYTSEPVAIIGSACRLPGDVSTPSQLWETLRRPRDVSSPLSSGRFNAAKFYHPDSSYNGTTNVRRSYILSHNIGAFDAHFFGINPTEATAMDPQQRLFLESTYEALEAAGLPLEKMRGSKTGVFVGVMNEDYSSISGYDAQNMPTYFASGTSRSILSNRVSYVFDLHGPSMTLDTACSSSLVALHLAVQSLRSGESTCAIVGGSNLLLSPAQYIAGTMLSLFSSSGQSRMWDKDANGYARGEGIGVIILKTLSQALADCDQIECIVRETGINQDGRTKGLTIPSKAAQTNLIETTYRKAGLDLSKASDRPQYFEAHGTGTAAGDPVEAGAIDAAFFKQSGFQRRDSTPLYVGSIKTVLGHSEGAAGVAGVMKAALALRYGTIPPNLLFDEISPKVKPFYTNLRIAKQAEQWPTMPAGLPKRASVNSFGFGGTNSHAILEEYLATTISPSPVKESDHSDHISSLIPFNFSAASEKSLRTNLAAYASFLRENPSVSLRDLSWTLNARRSALASRLSIIASSRASLIHKLEESSQINDAPITNSISFSRQGLAKTQSIWIFTGQGAQWATMGSDLLKSSPIVAARFKTLQESLDTLRPEHRPSWTLQSELLKDASTSRISEAHISQPICTAVQIAVVDLLRSAKIHCSVVVGHSSGEIAAAYVAGYLSAEDAIRIAYYRGHYLSHEDASGGIEGRMLAVGITQEDAHELCELPLLEGKICIAAYNSPTSLTLSGEIDAIEEAKEILEDEDKFARLLKVNKAYHSHLMLPSTKHYEQALRDCGIHSQPRPRGQHPAWVSSLTGENAENIDVSRFGSTYWADNMAQPVHFAQAVKYAAGSHGPFDFAIEVGPHPTLMKPTLENIESIYGQQIPYFGSLSRGRSGVEAFAGLLGSLWTSVGTGIVDWTALDEAVYGTRHCLPKPLQGLPGYSWDHDTDYWHETRYTKAFRSQGQGPHPLLGSWSSDEAENESRFRNYLSTKRLPWLSDHRVAGQIVFPAAGYLVAAIEAAAGLFPSDLVQMVELADVSIRKALIIPDDGSTVEVLTSLKVTKKSPEQTEALFSFYSEERVQGSTILAEHASGTVIVVHGPPCDDRLPVPYQPSGEFVHVEPERLYNYFQELGLEYEGPFRSLVNLKRRAKEAIGYLRLSYDGEDVPLIVHPGILDSALQGILLAFSYPYDGQLRCPYLPTGVDHVRVDVSAYRESIRHHAPSLPFYSSVYSGQTSGFLGDVEVHSAAGDRVLIQLQGMCTKPLTPSTAANDAKIFFETTWALEMAHDLAISCEPGSLESNHEGALLLERVASYHFRHLSSTFPRDKREALSAERRNFLDYSDHCLASTMAGTHPRAHKSWISDSEKDLADMIQQSSLRLDLTLLTAATERLTMPDNGQRSAIATHQYEDQLQEFFFRLLGDTYLDTIRRIIQSLSHRFAHMNILEIGGSSGGAASVTFLQELNGSFGSYTYTDTTSDLLERAKVKVSHPGSPIRFQVLDLSRSISEQGYADHSYDLVIAPLVLHKARDLDQALVHVRKLLRPAGFLIVLDITDDQAFWPALILGGLHRGWPSWEDGRWRSPFVSATKWEALMRKTGFSGALLTTPNKNITPASVSVMLFQATDERVELLSNPLATKIKPLALGCLTVIGGEKNTTSKLFSAISRHYDTCQHISSLAEVAEVELPWRGTVVSLVELDECSIFQNITPAELAGIQNLFKQSKSIIWVACGAHDSNPYKRMFVGIQRTMALEMPEVRTQFLDHATLSDIDPDLIAARILLIDVQISWGREHSIADLLWHIEPEVLVRDRRVLIPRLRLSPDRNLRYNAARRYITLHAAEDGMRLSVESQGMKLRLKAIPELAGHTAGGIKLTHSLLKAVRVTKESSAYLSLGVDSRTNEPVLLFSRSLDTCVNTPTSWVLPAPRHAEEAIKAMMSLYTQLLAQGILSRVSPGQTLAVLDPGHQLGDLLTELATSKGVPLILLSTKGKSNARPWTFIHKLATKDSLQKLLSRQISIFFDLSTESAISNLVAGCLPPRCKTFSFADLVSDCAVTDISHFDIREVADCLSAAWIGCSGSKAAPLDTDFMPKLHLNDITCDEYFLSQEQAILSWERQETVQLQVHTASQQVSFSSNKTYWLVGLKSGLGRSLCQWMVEQGARYVAISSRNPDLDPDWVQDMASRGCIIRTFSSDVTERESVRQTFNRISETMPPVAGVAHGAMVLHDSVFLELDIERLNKVTRPKVEGSLYLDEIFSAPTLEFFVLFSSIAYVAGNAGQSAYSAANAFMVGLAARRRSRGLAASALNIGAIVGNGYISRQPSEDMQSALLRAGLAFLSEQDFIEVFAEGVLASHPASRDNFEASTGLQLNQRRQHKVKWELNPMFQHLTTPSDDELGNGNKGHSILALRKQISNSGKSEELFQVLQDAFLSKLRLALNADPNKPLVGLSPEELGIDSLIAVELRSWFYKELGVDISVLKLMNSPTILDLLYTVQELLATDALPSQSTNDSSSEVGQTSLEARVIQPLSISAQSIKPIGLSLSSSTTVSVPSSEQTTADSQDDTQDTPADLEELVDKNPWEFEFDNAFERIVPMSFAQSGFWLLTHFVEDQTSFNITATLRLTGYIDLKRFEKALRSVGQRHEALRTAFYADQGNRRGLQGVLSAPAPTTFSHSIVTSEEQFEKGTQEMQSHVFDLAHGDCLRTKILSISDTEHCLILGYHHIAMDGIGLQILFAEMQEAYEETLDETGSDICQYPDYAIRQSQEYESGRWAAALAYWRRQFATLPPVLPLLSLSLKPSRASISTFRSYSTRFPLDEPLKVQIQQCCRRLRVTPFHFYSTVFAILLFRHAQSATEDMCIGIGHSGRNDADILRSLGLFLNPLPLRMRLKATDTFADVLRATRVTGDDAFTNSFIPFDVLLDELNVPRSVTHTPLFQAFLNYRQNAPEFRTFCGCTADGELISTGRNAYDIWLDIIDRTGSESFGILAVNCSHYLEQDAQVLQKTYSRLLIEFARNPALQVSWPSLNLQEDIERAIVLGRGPEPVSLWPATIVERIDDMAALYGDNPALTTGYHKSLNYTGMMDRVHFLSSSLLEMGVSSTRRVGILQGPGFDWVCSLLAVLRTGAACVPMDPQVGQHRLLAIAKDCLPMLILVDNETSDQLGSLESIKTIVMNVSDLVSTVNGDAIHQPSQAKSSYAAVVTYTSGSTGVPKGVVVRHESYTNLFEFTPSRWGIQEGKEVVLQQSSYAFDMSILQILTCLCYGGNLVIVGSAMRRDPTAICDIISSQGITFSLATPTEYISWMGCGHSNALRESQWRTAMTGGEPLTLALYQEFQSLAKHDLHLIDCYGPAEATIGCADRFVSYAQGEFDSTVGFSPLPNMSIAILDSKMQHVPVGVAGQIAIGGAGVASGYLGQSALTSTKFLPNGQGNEHFKSQGWTTLHLSGDRGRFTNDGHLILHGRIEGSTQLKIRGIRIDLEDVENAILTAMFPHVAQAAVSPRTNQENEIQFMVAFVVLSTTNPPANPLSFVAELPQKLPLPQYMRPSLAVALDRIPMTASDKLDRAALDGLALPIPIQKSHESEDGRLGQMEQALLRLWKEVLPAEIISYHSIDVNSNFFHVGGSSLSLVNLQGLIKDQFRTSIPMARLFEAITLGQMATLLTDHDFISQRPTIIDWEKEIVLPPNLDDLAHTGLPPPPSGTIRSGAIILTGATGLLGGEILRQLAENDGIIKIFCVAVRKPRSELPEIFSHHKVVVFSGDLSAKQLGLSDKETQTIFGEASAVIHAGADTSFMKTYQSLKPVNLASTQELARLSLGRRLPLHYVSTASVGRLSGQDTFSPVSVQQYYPSPEGVDGYTTSKWASEVYLERFHARFGLAVTIHRPSSITSERVPETDLMGYLSQFSQNTKTVPALSVGSGYLDFVSVEGAATSIVEETMKGSGSDSTGIRYIHQCGEVEMAMGDLKSMLSDKMGETPTVLPLEEWLASAAKASTNPLLAIYLASVAPANIFFPRLLK